MAGTPLATAFVRVRPAVDKSQFKSETDRAIRGAGLDKSGAAHGKVFGTNFTRSAGSAFRGIGGMLTAAFAVAGGIALFKNIIAEGQESARITRLTANVIRSTGGAAHVSARQVAELADAMMRKTGIDDETIRSGENLMLTFTRIRNEAGRGNDVFSQATQLATDMSVVMGQDLNKSVLQVGKALQDPVKGATALRRVGVMLTQQQTEQIAAFVKSGDVLSAQKVILAELRTEFGGAAAAAADPLQRLKTTLGEIGETAGTALLPPLNNFVTWIQNTGIPAISNLWRALSPKITPAMKTAQSMLATGWGLLIKGAAKPPPGAPAAGAGPAGRMRGPGEEAGPAALRAAAGPGGRMQGIAEIAAPPPALPGWQRLLITIHDIGAEVARRVVPAFRILWSHVTAAWAVLVKAGIAMLPAWRDVWKFIQELVPVVRNLWNALAPIAGPVLKVALAALVLAFRALAWLLANVVGPALIGISIAVKNGAGWIVTGFTAVVNFLKSVPGWVSSAWGAIVSFFTGLPGKIGNVMGLLWRKGADIIQGLWNGAVAIWASVTGWFRSIPGWVSGFFAGAWNWITWAGRSIVQGLWNGLTAMWGSVTGWFRSIPGWVANFFAGAWNWINWAGKAIIQGLWNGIKAIWDSVTSWFKGLPGKILSALGISSPPSWAISAGKDIMWGVLRGLAHGASDVKGFFVGLASDMLGPFKSIWSTISGLFGGGGVAPSGPVQNYAKKLLEAYGWGGQWGAFNALVMGESGWRWNATNPQSGAYGIPQALPPGKMAAAGADWRTSPYTQLRWMMGYIKSVYGSPARAYAAWLSRSPHWYGGGGLITEPVYGIGRSGRAYGFGERGPEQVIPGATMAEANQLTAETNRLLAENLKALHRLTKVTAVQGEAFAGTLNGVARTTTYRGLAGR